MQPKQNAFMLHDAHIPMAAEAQVTKLILHDALKETFRQERVVFFFGIALEGGAPGPNDKYFHVGPLQLRDGVAHTPQLLGQTRNLNQGRIRTSKNAF